MSDGPSIGAGISVGPISIGASVSLPSIPGMPGLGGAGGAGVFRDEIQILMGTDQSSMKDVTQMFPPLSKLTIHYEDPISFQSDTLEITFSDIGKLIIKSANIKKGLWLKVKILQYNRDYPGSLVQRDLGSFMIDQIKHVWPITQTTLMASSVPISSQIKLTLQNRTRLAVSIRDLGEQVAKENGLAFQWAAPAIRNRVINEAQQWNESDLQMLSKVCKSNGLSFKIKDINGKQTLVIFDEQDLEKQPPVYTIDFNLLGAGMELTHGELTTQSQDIYSTSKLCYYDPYSNTLYVAQAKAPDGTAEGSGAALISNDHKNTAVGGSGSPMSKDGQNAGEKGDQNSVPDLGGKNAYTQDAMDEEAQMILRAKNIKEFHSVLTTAGTLCFPAPSGVAIESGVVCTFKNIGLYDGNWIVQKVTIHTSDGKLIVEIEWRKCIDFSKGTTVTPVPWAPISGSDEEGAGSGED